MQGLQLLYHALKTADNPQPVQDSPLYVGEAAKDRGAASCQAQVMVLIWVLQILMSAKKSLINFLAAWWPAPVYVVLGHYYHYFHHHTIPP